MFEIPEELQGVLPVQWLKKAAAHGVIRSTDGAIPPANFQPASLDLRLGDTAYRLRCSFLPDTNSVSDKLEDFTMGEFSLDEGAVLERNRPYLIPLMEGLNLPENVRARANPRSTTGRLDIFTRVITDYGHRFDEVGGGYRGRLYLEVVSRSFTVRVRSGVSLNQLRLIKGDAHCNDRFILDAHEQDPLVLFDGGQLPLTAPDVADGLSLGVDLMGDEYGVVGYRAKKNSSLVDLSLVGGHDANEFWEPISAEPKRRLVLEPEEFYLLMSAESVRIRPEFAAEMTALDPHSGEFRTHYAGFFDPGFGYTDQGTRAVMEVRAHDVPFMIEHRQRVCKLGFERMLETPEFSYGEEIGSSYQGQTLKLSKHFYLDLDDIRRTWAQQGQALRSSRNPAPATAENPTSLPLL